MPCRETSCSSSSLLPVVSVYSRLWISFYDASTERRLGEVDMPADDDSTCYSLKAIPSSFSNSAMFSSVYLSSSLSEDLGRE